MRKSTTAFNLGICIFLGACAHREAETNQLAVELPSNWSAKGTKKAKSTDLANDWIAGFKDDQLVALVDEALLANPTLQTAAARMEQAMTESRLAGAERLPNAGAGLQGQRQRANLASGYNYLNSYNLNVNLSWEIDLWGRLGNKQKAARASEEASRNDYEAAKLSLAAQVTKAWFNLKEATGQTQQARKTMRAYRNNLQTLETRFESGLSNSLELLQTRAELANADAAFKARQRLQDQATRTLEILLGRYPMAELKTLSQLPELRDPIPAGLPAQLLERRPDLIAARERVLAAEQNVRASRKEWLPRLSLTSSIGTASSEFEDLLKRDFGVGNIVGNLAQPLFQGGRIRANVDRSKSLHAQAKANYHNIALRAFLEVESALASEHFLTQESRRLSQANNEAAAAEALAWERYQNGTLDFINVLNTQRAAASARSRYLGIQNQLLQNRVDCLLALGGSLNTAL
jgi:NodT family efflux transporter outer membrane factor (OMF) lipoprotein